jgi:hypothetical protein
LSWKCECIYITHRSISGLGCGSTDQSTSAHQLPIALSLQSISEVFPMASSSTSTSSSNFQSIFNASLQAYNNKTKNILLDHPLADQLQSCDSLNAVLSVLQDLIQQFEQRRTSDERLKNWLNPTVNVLYSFSATLGEGVGMVSIDYLTMICTLIVIYQVLSPTKTIFAGIGVLLLVRIFIDLSIHTMMTPAPLRPRRMWMRVKTCSLICLSVLRAFSSVSSLI